MECWLSAKGRTTAVFQLLRLADDHLMLVLADGDADAIASQLQRFVFRRKVKVLVRDDLAAAGAFTAPEAASGAAIAQAAGDGWELDLGSDALPRTLRIGAADAFAAGSETDEAAFALAAPGRPALRAAAAGRRPARGVDPAAAGSGPPERLQREEGLLSRPEIVARTHFLGKAKRAVQLLHTAAPAQAGDGVQQDGAALGTIACVAGDLALAVLPLEAGDADLQVGDAIAQRVPLLDGLAR